MWWWNKECLWWITEGNNLKGDVKNKFASNSSLADVSELKLKESLVDGKEVHSIESASNSDKDKSENLHDNKKRKRKKHRKNKS